MYRLRRSSPGHDEKLWQEDCAEIFIDPQRQMGYCQFLVNPNGAMTDLKAPPGGSGRRDWNAQGVQSAVKTTDMGYTVEMRIPFAAMEQSVPEPGSVWGINFTREGPTCGGMSTWAPVGRKFCSPQQFGLLIFGSRTAYLQNILNDYRAQLDAVTDADAPKLQQQALALADVIAAELAADDASEKWDALNEQLNELSDLIRQIRLGGATYLFWAKDIWSDITPDMDVPFDAEPVETVKIRMAKNTRKPCGFVVTNFAKKAIMGRFVLPGDQWSRFNGKVLSFKHMGYMQCSGGQMTADLLFDLPPMDLLTVPAGTSELLWIEIDSTSLEPGHYSIPIEFVRSYAGMDSRTFVLDLTVEPIDLAKPHLLQRTYLNAHGAQNKPWYAKSMMRYGMNVLDVTFTSRRDNYPTLDRDGTVLAYDPTSLDQGIDNMLSVGVHQDELFILLGQYMTLDYERVIHGMDASGKSVRIEYPTPAWQRAYANAIRCISEHLVHDRGLRYDQFAFYPADEPRGDLKDPMSSASIAILAAQLIKQVDPNIQTMCNAYLPSSDSERAEIFVRVV